MKDFNGFIDSIESDNTRKVVNIFKDIGNYDYNNCTVEDLENIVLNQKPNSPKAIITVCYVIRAYAKYLDNSRLEDMVRSLDKKDLWLKAKPTAKKKYISNCDFEEIYHDIGVYEDYNGFYIQTLFRAVYEGIYNDDMSVLKNLRASDINDNIVTLRYDSGETFELEISTQLADDLRELGKVDVWERRNRYGTISINIQGLYINSCFKVESRKGSAKDSVYKFCYYRILRKIFKEYMDYPILPMQLYVSGIMHRLKINLNDGDITLQEAFAENNKDRLVNRIIANELERSNYTSDVKSFREMVKGHLDVFDK